MKTLVTVTSLYPRRAAAPMLSYFDHLFEVFEAGRPSNRVRVLELNEWRAMTAASIELGVSAEKLRAIRVSETTIVQPTHLESLKLC